MTASQLPLGLAQPHNNQQLFADHYLNVVLPERPEWRALFEESAQAQADIRAIFDTFTPSGNEAQTEDGLIKPVLARLGHTVEVQAALRTPRGTKKPDYVFYQDAAARASNKDVTLTDAALVGKAYAVGDAKYWDRPLDVSLKLRSSEPDINKVPSDQIAFYMLHSGVTWGVLTNGRLWRLYHKDTAQKQDRYYEVDLELLTRAGTPADFAYFYAFFRRAAFDDHALSAASILRASVDAARAIGDNLRQQVYRALRHLAQGFLDYRANQLAPDPASLKLIYDNSLTVLYRLLFILYAEARELLPLRGNADYRTEHSLAAVARDVAQRRDSGRLLLPTGSALWARLRDLCDIINEGSPPLSVATFNGGLFDPQRHPFLTRHTVGDAQLAAAIDLLSRTNGAFIDYRDLAERHLGTIYEGLLEQHLAPIEPTPEGWTIDLFDSAGERHRTGSYYTPDFVVQYIVAQTVGPALERAVAGKQRDEERLAAILELNVCDPAMGSGHFLVSVMEYVALYLVDLGVSPGEEAGGEADLAFWKRRVAQSCIYGVDLNPLAVDLAKLSLWLATAASDRPLSFLDHHLRCGNALVGARMADLQLRTTATSGVAKRAQKQAAQIVAAGQVSMLDDDAFRQSMQSAVGSLGMIESNPARTVDDVKQQERAYQSMREGFERQYLKQADLVAATRLGLAVDAALWPSLSDYVTGRSMAALPKVVELAAQARALVAQHRPFHWELEFPEVFFDEHGVSLGDQAGFDAVVGNPPYVRQELLAPIKPYLQASYQQVYSGTADLYVYFVAQGMALLQQGGRLSYISSNAWLQTNYAEPLRRYLRSETTLETLIDLGNNRTFAEAPDVCPSIFVVSKQQPGDDHRFAAIEFKRGEQPVLSEAQLQTKTILITQHDQPDAGWQIEGDETRSVFRKLLLHHNTLGTVVNNRIFLGLKTGLNEAFIIDQPTRDRLIANEPTGAAIIKSMLRGEDLRPWFQEDEGRWLILFPNGWTASRYGKGLDESSAWQKITNLYPTLSSYLEAYAAPARARGDKGEYWWELRPCSYYEVFTSARIYWPEIGKIPRFSWSDDEGYINNKGFVIANATPYLLGILQSRCTWFAISKLCLHNKFRGGLWEYHTQPQFVSKLPIPDAPAAEREAIGALAMQITEQAKARYALHRRARRRIQSDLAGEGRSLNQKLTAWWDLDFPAFREEVKKALKREIAVKERDDWEEWLDAQRARHRDHTEAIIRLETQLNERVYQLFDLTREEIALIEESTKYKYGEV
jgi:Eco57I restriction-modification methylase/N-6 DNA Methylase